MQLISIMFKIFILTLLLVVTPISHSEEVEIGGLLLDNTISRQGHDFYYQFSLLWQDIPKTQGINVQIIEQLVPRAGTRLMIKMNNITIYATHMGRRQSSIKRRVEQAVFILINAIARSDDNFDNPDMANNGW
ncbi:MAG: curli production assembly protein CsgE [Alteromonadaceae bacterium]|nr:curli production assembly protein CsgE [Alteromonadaceae bacterium]